ncbi:MAG: NAD-dependent epimerase/dehydratase family protein [Alphaproteobacteria bacterium]|nr:NAD-dependent epimerase/dehydratase family protein [Alphaproteobacteria bacterium]
MKALVTGGGGYLGKAIVRQLLDRGDAVVVVGRSAYPEVTAWGATCVPVDLSTDDPALVRACEGVDVVFHVAALPPYAAKPDVFVATNVGGTERVVAACRAAGVPRLVFTSTPSATFDGTDAEGVTEADCPYPDRYETPYAETKARAEQHVLAAHGADLLTTALRPHLIYGPEEPHMLPRLIQRNRAGRLRIIGDGTNRVGLTYIDNAAAAHLQAADALAPGSAHGGKAYFVTDPEPVVLWDWIHALFVGVGEPPLRRHVSLGAARAAGTVFEGIWSLFGLSGVPPMTRFVASQLATSHWYDLSGGRADFGLHAPVSGDDGLARTIAWFRDHPVPR